MVLVLPMQVFADCRCACVDGKVEALCSSSIDIEPICAPRVCPIKPPAVKPIQQPRVPPIGTKACTQKQVYNEDKGKYEWQEVCN